MLDYLVKLEDYISFVVDDNPNKLGLFMPKSKIPIVSSKELYNNKISICLLSMNPLHDEKVIFQLKKLENNGVQIKSIYPTSQYYFLNESI